jgi:outer membrane protein OmpA-like peptidoglycan-associated protein
MDASKHRLFAEIHFEPDTAVLIESGRPQLEAAGRYLQANPGIWILVRTYTAPFGTSEGRFIVALDRARFCRDYLLRNFGISPERIIVETLASERLPENVVIAEWITYRTAELIMIDE